MPIIKWHPFHDFDEFFEDLAHKHHHNGWDLAVDVSEDKSNVYVDMNIPGINPDKVDIEVEDTYLKVSGSREEKKEEKEKNYYRKEIRRGSFERVISLPSPVLGDKAKAEFSDGVLKITLPKEKGKKLSKIKVAKK